MNYRRILFESKEAMENYISGVILFDETIRQSNNQGERLVDIIKKSGVLPGIKVDMGAKDLAKMSRRNSYRGFRWIERKTSRIFRSWSKICKMESCNFYIRKKIHHQLCINANAHALARYAALCQESVI